MRSIFGLFLLMTGVGVGAHAYYPDTVEQHIHIGKIVRVLAPTGTATPVATAADTLEPRTFSPGERLLVTGSIDHKPRVAALSESSRPVLASTPKLVRSDDRPPVVLPTRSSGHDFSRALNGNLSQGDRWKLVRTLQSELKRVGCYRGTVDGSWGAGSRYAIRDFLQRVNSALPADEPDHIMLSLLRSHRGKVCQKPCTKGYSRSSSGRCLPHAIVAGKKPPPANKDVTAEAAVPAARLIRSAAVRSDRAVIPAQPTLVERKPPLAGRMAVGGPLPSEYSARETAPGVSAVPRLTRRPRAASRPSAPAPRVKKRKAKKKYKKPRRYTRATSYTRKARKRARRRAIMREAFGDGF